MNGMVMIRLSVVCEVVDEQIQVSTFPSIRRRLAIPGTVVVPKILKTYVTTL